MVDRGESAFDVADEEGKTALHHAAIGGFDEIVTTLLKDYSKDDVNQISNVADTRGETVCSLLLQLFLID